MHCQVVYWDDHECPPLVMKREGRGKKSAAAVRQPAGAAEVAGKRPPAPVKVTVNSKEIEHVKE